MHSRNVKQTSWKVRLGGLLLLSCLTSSALAVSVSYTYDTLGRLSKATYSTGVIIVYAYDAAGNRSSTVVTGAP